MSLNAHVFQHVPFEGIGGIQTWLDARNARINSTCFFRDETLPSLHQIDLLIVMGGPMSVNDDAEFPWLRAEKALIRNAIASGVPVLGICLGAQLIASALGSRIYTNTQNEIGWFPVRAVNGPPKAFSFPETIQAFHWHGETFDLPPGAVHLAESDACKHQAFQIGEHVLGLQFHLETTPESARALIDKCRHELEPGPFVQAEEELLATPEGHYAKINALMHRLLDNLTQSPLRTPHESFFSPL